MRKLGVLLVVLATLHGEPAAAEKNDKKKASQPDFYPLALGTKWHHQVEVNGQVVNTVSHIAKIEKINGKSLARMEVSVGGNAVAVTEHLSATDKGVFRHRYNGLEIDPPLCLLKYPIKEGEAWQSKVKVGGEEVPMNCQVLKWDEVEVPAGKFKAVRMVLTTVDKGQPVVTEYWFAPGVGIVLQTADLNGLNITLKLEKYVEGKAEPKDSK